MKFIQKSKHDSNLHITKYKDSSRVLLQKLFKRENVVGTEIYVQHKGRILRGKLLRYKPLIADNYKLTILTNQGHAVGNLQMKSGVVFVDAKEVKPVHGFNYKLLGNLKVSKDEFQRLAYAFR